MHRLLKFILKYFTISVFLFFISCAGQQGINSLFSNLTPYESYSRSLQQANLATTALGKKWIEAGEKSLNDSLFIQLPYRETGYFSATSPSATAYRFKAKRGEKIIIRTEIAEDIEDVKVFTDLFLVPSQPKVKLEHLLAADTTSNVITYEVSNDAVFIIRVQPELLRNARYHLTLETAPQIDFPVNGKSHIGSFWGDPRDNGKRKHHGIDIFAARGTPAVAVAEGYITRVNSNNLGGKVVWMSDLKRKQTYYYAHLDTQLVNAGKRVKAGDTLGLVGNTGNARHTPPHLHFGIYTFGEGAINPLHFVDKRVKKLLPVSSGDNLSGSTIRVSSSTANLRLTPEKKSVVISKLKKNTILTACATTSDWYCIKLPDNTKGFVHKSVVEEVKKGRNEVIKQDVPLFDAASVAALIMDSIPVSTKVKILGSFGSFHFIELPNGIRGWMSAS